MVNLTLIEHDILKRMTLGNIFVHKLRRIVIFPTLELRNKYMSEFQFDSPSFGVPLNILCH